MAAVAVQAMESHVLGSGDGIDGRQPSPLPRNAQLPRSASYSFLPDAKDAAYVNPDFVTIKGSFSEADLIAPADELVDISPPDSSGWTTPDEHAAAEPKVPAEQARELVAELQKSPKITVRRFATSVQDEQGSGNSSMRQASSASTSLESTRTASSSATTTTPVAPTQRSRPVSQSFSRPFNSRRKSWYASSPSVSSRSPSPKQEQTIRPHQVGTNAAPAPLPVGAASQKKATTRRRDSRIPGKQKIEHAPGEESARPAEHSERPPSRRSTLSRRKSRPLSGIFSEAKKDGDYTSVSRAPAVPRVPSIPKSFSTDKLPSVRSGTPQADRAAPMPRLVSTERVPANGGLSIPMRKKDELWSVFRALDGDYTKFVSKSTAFKTNVVRQSLLPFLKTYANHPSNRSIRPEDLDRRANILNKWWVGLIEMLHGRNNQSISGTDRPAILDGISGIMERPEWRLHPSPFCPLDQRIKGSATPRNRSTTSFASSASSDFLIESVNHNVRNIYIQNLSAQMAFVVDKMSLRNASASLVTFCGKACAYAFMFVPGMADVLVRLWDLQMEPLRRVLQENGIGKFDNLSDLGVCTVSNFPPCLHQLGFASLMKYMRKLRTPPPLPLGTANIQWWGHWLERWTGRESDLFYVFVKYFHILAADFLAPDSTKKERMCAPGMLLVHAQILTNLDATIHRDFTLPHQDSAAPAPTQTFDDLLADPDAIASPLPLPPTPTNAVRIMAENRLIMLIRDFLSERTAEHPVSRRLFAESFNDILQTAARGISVYDHAACYTLLDFLEEALVLLARNEHAGDAESTTIDSDFWQLVWKKMISSQNTMTEVRLYAFLYTIWNTVVCGLDKKGDVCLGFLLEPDIFESRFNHWCPMVRAYFMRLLCWRVGRFDGELGRGDVRIYETLLERLQGTWSYYLFLRTKAELEGTPLPATNPCNPAPSRRLLIIRTDTQAAPGGSFLSFDGIVPPSSTALQLPSKRRSTLSPMVEADTRPDPAAVSDSQRERGFAGFFRMIMRSRSPSKPPSRAERPTTQAGEGLKLNGGLTRSATEEVQVSRPRAAGLEVGIKATSPAAHRNYSFKFSLEYQPNKPAAGPLRLAPPRLPMPAHQFLQAHSAKAQPAAYMRPVEPVGESESRTRYAGRALAEWMVVVAECQSFFERRLKEGVPNNKAVETPTLGVEVFKRPS